MLRILLSSYGSLKTRGGWFYGTAQKLQNGFIRLGHGVEFFSDRDIARAASPIRSRILGRRACNRLFLDYVRNYAPHLIVLCHADLIDNDTLAEVRRTAPKTRLVEVRVDALHNPPTLPHMRARAPHLHHSFLTTAGSALDLVGTKEAPASFIPNPVDSGIETGSAHRRNDQRHDAIYSRRPVIAMPPNDYRTAVVEEIERTTALNVHSIGIHGGSQIFGQAYFDLVSDARIGLNLSAKALTPLANIQPQALMRLYSSDRIAHYGGNGLLVMNDSAFALDEIMREGEEFIAFGSPPEAAEKARWFIEHPEERQAVAAAGHAAFHRRFSSAAVASFIVAKALGEPLPANIAWPQDDHTGRDA